MDTRTGEIMTESDMLMRLRINPSLRRHLSPMAIAPTPKQLARKPVSPGGIGRVGRNEKCPCGSGKKFKKCCLKP